MYYNIFSIHRYNLYDDDDMEQETFYSEQTNINDINNTQIRNEDHVSALKY